MQNEKLQADLTVINLYSVPVLVDQLQDDDQLKLEEITILKSIQMEKQYGDTGNYLSKESHILETYKLDRIKNICNNYVNKYTNSLLGLTDEFVMFKSWLSMNVNGTLHEEHSHRNTMISCLIYFDEYMSDQPLAPINFWQEGLDQIFKSFQFRFKVKEPNQYNNNYLSIFPKTNTILVFPAWIRHGTQASSSNIERYCIGTNYFFQGESSTGYHNIKISVS